MSFTEAEVKRAAELKVWLETKISELEGEVSRLKETLMVVDALLRRASFMSASELPPQPIKAEAPSIPETIKFKETIPLQRAQDKKILANAYVSDSQVVIVPSSDVKLRATTLPFRSFFINKILEGMKSRDAESLSQGKMRPDEAIIYKVEEEEGFIKKVAVTNYRSRSRLNEIVNTATWAFTKMLEKGGGPLRV